MAARFQAQSHREEQLSQVEALYPFLIYLYKLQRIKSPSQIQVESQQTPGPGEWPGSEITCMHAYVLSLCKPMDCSPPGSSVRGILQARILE